MFFFLAYIEFLIDRKKPWRPSKFDFFGFLWPKINFSEHHFSHAASAFYPSPFKNAVILTLDGVGEWATTSVAIGNDNEIKILKEIHFPHSIGLLY